MVVELEKVGGVGNGRDREIEEIRFTSRYRLKKKIEEKKNNKKIIIIKK